MHQDWTLITGGTFIDATGADPRPEEKYDGIGVLETELVLLEQLASLDTAVEKCLSRPAG